MANIVNIPADPYTMEQLIFTSGAAVGFSTANYEVAGGEVMQGLHARVVFMNLESDAGDPSIRYKINGSAPAANDGMLWFAEDYITLDSPVAIRNFQGIASGAGEELTAVVVFFT